MNAWANTKWKNQVCQICQSVICAFAVRWLWNSNIICSPGNPRAAPRSTPSTAARRCRWRRSCGSRPRRRPWRFRRGPAPCLMNKEANEMMNWKMNNLIGFIRFRRFQEFLQCLANFKNTLQKSMFVLIFWLESKPLLNIHFTFYGPTERKT